MREITLTACAERARKAETALADLSLADLNALAAVADLTPFRTERIQQHRAAILFWLETLAESAEQAASAL